VGESWQSSLIDAAEFAVEIRGVDVQVRERRNGAWIFVRPVEPGASQELHSSFVDARRHAVSV
jgi:hypothetical protein